MPGYIDFHCDTLMMFAHEPSADMIQNPNRMVDIDRLNRAGCAAQFFATFMPPVPAMEKRGMSDEDYRSKLYTGLMETAARASRQLSFTTSYEDYLKNKAAGRTSAFLTFEDGRMIQGEFSNLEKYCRMGYRLITLTWNFPNRFGSPNSRDPEVMNTGLTEFGLEAVPYMNDLGMIVDVSHLSDGGFWDVVNVSKKPFIASHSCARALTPHTRNLTDDMLRAIGDKGGFVGVNFAPEFVGETTDCSQSTVSRICDHIQYMAKLAGMGAVGIGSDFDGIGGKLEVGQPTDIYKLFDELSRRGWSEDQIDRFALSNGERILRECLVS